MEFPLQLVFKFFALAPQFYVRHSSGQTLLYVRQKMFRLKEAIHVYADESKQQELFTIAADRVIDFSAKYTFRKTGGGVLGAVRRSGMRSLWRTHYTVLDAADQPCFEIREENAWTKVLDGLLGQIPILGMLTGYFLHPAYLVTPVGSSAPVLRLVKKAAFLEGKFDILSVGLPLGDEEATRIVLALLMLTLLERKRG